LRSLGKRVAGRFIFVLSTLFCMSLLSGCSTVPDPYIPATIGSFAQVPPNDGLQLTIEAFDDTPRFHEPITFRARVMNFGETPVWVPRIPKFIFYWVYPNGQRDHYVLKLPPAQHFTEQTAVLLPPGQQMVYTEEIPTFYFPRPGIMEFRAVYHVPQNLNSQLEPFWVGRLTSNTYGVNFVVLPTKAWEI
jgi:hypothetical protein